MSYKVSVIIPVYNVEKFVERCAHALFAQTLADIEFIFVDDCSPDSSIELIKKVSLLYPARVNHIRFLRHQFNKGLPAARNTGLAEAKGTYIYHCDSDDWVDEIALEESFNFASKFDADLIWMDFYNSYPDREEYISQKNTLNKQDCIKNLLQEKLHGAVWNKLVKRELYLKNNIRFVEGCSMWEDLVVSIQLFNKADKVFYFNKAFYHYVQYNLQALSLMNITKRLQELKSSCDYIIKYLDREASNIYDNEYNYLKLAAKQNLLFSTDKSSFSLWNTIYPESNSFIMSFDALPLHLRLLGWCSDKNLVFIIQVYLFLKKIKNPS